MAAHYAQMIVQRHLQNPPEAPIAQEAPETCYKNVDLNSLQNLQSRTIGGEYVGLAASQRLGLEALFTQLGLNARQTKLAPLSIIGRLVHPGSELQTADWARHLSGIGELLGVDFSHLSHNALYRISDVLLEH